MRIIAGEKRGAVIAAPKGANTRPTLDRVRESLFGILQYEIPGATVLDLFGGSGALGLEAVSRGAAHAVINDPDREAAQVIAANVKKLRFEGAVTQLRLDYATAVKRAVSMGRRFNVVFLDPPYKSGLINAAMGALLEAGALEDGFVVAAEHAAAFPPQTPEGYTLRDRRAYGEAAISFYCGCEREDKEQTP